MAVTRYLAQPRIEDPIWLEPSDVSLLRTRISEAEAELQSIDGEISESAKLAEIASETFFLPFVELHRRFFQKSSSFHVLLIGGLTSSSSKPCAVRSSLLQYVQHGERSPLPHRASGPQLAFVMMRFAEW